MYTNAGNKYKNGAVVKIFVELEVWMVLFAIVNEHSKERQEAGDHKNEKQAALCFSFLLLFSNALFYDILYIIHLHHLTIDADLKFYE